jgi:pSer/pThr/pTyr-binding forkhead associated (FHA) protein
MVDAEDVISAVSELGWQEHENYTGIYAQLQQIARTQPENEASVTHIAVRNNGETVAVHSFPPGRIVVGRSPDNEIYIKSKFVSRHHLQFISDGKHCIVEDLNSTNGVFIGEMQIKKRKLRSGEIISIGVHELVYTNLSESGTEEKSDPDLEDTDSNLKLRHCGEVAADVAESGDRIPTLRKEDAIPVSADNDRIPTLDEEGELSDEDPDAEAESAASRSFDSSPGNHVA